MPTFFDEERLTVLIRHTFRYFKTSLIEKGRFILKKGGIKHCDWNLEYIKMERGKARKILLMLHLLVSVHYHGPNTAPRLCHAGLFYDLRIQINLSFLKLPSVFHYEVGFCHVFLTVIGKVTNETAHETCIKIL